METVVNFCSNFSNLFVSKICEMFSKVSGGPGRFKKLREDSSKDIQEFPRIFVGIS